MLNFIDNLLNRITMYRLVLYSLIFMLAAAVGLCAAGILPYNPIDVVYSTVLLLLISWTVNKIFAKVFEVPANVESDYITALILALILTPTTRLASLPLLFWAATLAQASKYILAWRGKHIFNPAAFAVVVTAFALNQSASWWVGTAWMLPVVLLGGLLVVRKIQRFDLVLSFLFTALFVIVATTVAYSDPITIVKKALLDTPILYFALIMLTEPLTAPPTKYLRMTYGVLVGLLYAPRVHFGPIYSTPELALVVGNVFAYFVSPKAKLMLSLQSITEIGKDTFDFVFTPNRKLAFQPGQYLEWTLDHKSPDSRGNRRYFTIASSPTEPNLHLGVKFYDPPSSFKSSLIDMKRGERILAGQLAGDFVLPKNKAQKLVFIAGGIGITPFRSMLKYLVDKNEKRNITVFYSNRSEDDLSYADVLVEAQEKLGIKIVLIMTEKQGRLTSDLIRREVPDFKQRDYYISGTHGMVVTFEDTLHAMGIPRNQIKIDFFPGFA